VVMPSIQNSCGQATRASRQRPAQDKGKHGGTATQKIFPHAFCKQQLLLQVLAGRYEARSAMITSNLESSKWPAFIGGPVMAAAPVCRIARRSAIPDMNGEGCRRRGTDKK